MARAASPARVSLLRHALEDAVVDAMRVGRRVAVRGLGDTGQQECQVLQQRPQRQQQQAAAAEADVQRHEAAEVEVTVVLRALDAEAGADEMEVALLAAEQLARIAEPDDDWLREQLQKLADAYRRSVMGAQFMDPRVLLLGRLSTALEGAVARKQAIDLVREVSVRDERLRSNPAVHAWLATLLFLDVLSRFHDVDKFVDQEDSVFGGPTATPPREENGATKCTRAEHRRCFFRTCMADPFQLVPFTLHHSRCLLRRWQRQSSVLTAAVPLCEELVRQVAVAAELRVNQRERMAAAQWAGDELGHAENDSALDSAEERSAARERKSVRTATTTTTTGSNNSNSEGGHGTTKKKKSKRSRFVTQDTCSEITSALEAMQVAAQCVALVARLPNVERRPWRLNSPLPQLVWREASTAMRELSRKHASCARAQRMCCVFLERHALAREGARTDPEGEPRKEEDDENADTHAADDDEDEDDVFGDAEARGTGGAMNCTGRVDQTDEPNEDDEAAPEMLLLESHDYASYVSRWLHADPSNLAVWARALAVHIRAPELITLRTLTTALLNALEVVGGEDSHSVPCIDGDASCGAEAGARPASLLRALLWGLLAHAIGPLRQSRDLPTSLAQPAFEDVIFGSQAAADAVSEEVTGGHCDWWLDSLLAPPLNAEWSVPSHLDSDVLEPTLSTGHVRCIVAGVDINLQPPQRRWTNSTPVIRPLRTSAADANGPAAELQRMTRLMWQDRNSANVDGRKHPAPPSQQGQQQRQQQHQPQQQGLVKATDLAVTPARFFAALKRLQSQVVGGVWGLDDSLSIPTRLLDAAVDAALEHTWPPLGEPGTGDPDAAHGEAASERTAEAEFPTQRLRDARLRAAQWAERYVASSDPIHGTLDIDMRIMAYQSVVAAHLLDVQPDEGGIATGASEADLRHLIAPTILEYVALTLWNGSDNHAVRATHETAAQYLSHLGGIDLLEIVRTAWFHQSADVHRTPILPRPKSAARAEALQQVPQSSPLRTSAWYLGENDPFHCKRPWLRGSGNTYLPTPL